MVSHTGFEPATLRLWKHSGPGCNPVGGHSPTGLNNTEVPERIRLEGGPLEGRKKVILRMEVSNARLVLPLPDKSGQARIVLDY